ncbi:MAG TPA: sugar phosphate isomerase/epimerase family protein [Anaerovoracaceae bacterium]|nr:sugar phosphate isomerase/epimerase family protein [Anaerovoracaceae bacterium]
MMKLGLVSAILPDYTFEEVFDYASETGFGCVEVCCWPVGKAIRRYAGVTHIDISTLDEAKMEYYKNYAKASNVEISSLGYYPNALDPDPEAAQVARDHIKKLIIASSQMGINMITTFIGKDKKKTVDENIEMFQEVWAPIMKLAEETGVKVAIENCPMYFTKDEWPGGNNLASTPYVWRRMFELSPNLGLNYDPSHPYLLGMDICKPLYEFKDRIFHVHFKDIKIHQDKLDEYGVLAYPALWHSPKLPGLGGVDFAAFVSALNDIRYSGPACIEVEDKAYESSIEDVKYGIEQSYRYMSQFLGK